MRIKALFCLALLGAGVATSMAQSNVYSLNVVGYYNVTVNAGQYKIVANQLSVTNNTVESLFGATAAVGVPGGTSLAKWTGTGYALNNKDTDFGWDDPSMVLLPGQATFIKNNAATNFTVTFVGEVLQGTNVLNIAQNYQMASSKVPQAGLLQAVLGYTPIGGVQVLQWTGVGYGISSYDTVFGWDNEPNVAVGEGFFFNSPSNHVWTRVFNVQ